MKQRIILFCLFIFCTTLLISQSISLPPSGDNQKSAVTQYIGSIVHVTVDYNSPDVTAPNGRDRTGQIWGQLVPFGMTDLGFGLRDPAPWRVGANENSTITFSHDVQVNGSDIKAGTYGLHLIVRETGPWTWIFSNNSTAWGSYFYKESEDALRVDAASIEAPFHEWLTFEFTDRQPDRTNLTMFWEKKQVSMEVIVPDVEEVYLTQIRKELESSAGFNYQGWLNAVNYCLQNNVNLTEALSWAESAISAPFVGVANYNTLATKGVVLFRLGRNEEAMESVSVAIDHPTATAQQVDRLGRQMIGWDLPTEALKLFELSHERFNGAWPTKMGLARGLSANGSYDKALEFAEMALKDVPSEQAKQSVLAAIEKLKNKENIN